MNINLDIFLNLVVALADQLQIRIGISAANFEFLINHP